MRGRLLSFAIAAGLLSLGALLLWSRAETEPRSRAAVPAPGALAWRAGDRATYRVETHAAVDLHLPGSPASQEARLSGRLRLHVVAAGAEEVRVAFRLARAAFTGGGGSEPALDARLRTPFEATFDASGRPLAFTFPAALPAGERRILEELVRTFQVVAGPAGARAWSEREENALGAYVADYRTVGDGRLLKRKREYTEVRAPGGAEVRILASRALVTLDPARSWIAGMELSETSEMRVDGRPFMRSVLTAVLAPAHDEAGDDPEPAVAPAPPRAPAELDGLVRALAASGGRDAAAAYAVRDLLVACPAAATKVPGLLATLDDGTASSLLNVLELAGTPDAQAALTTVLEGAAFGRMNRLRAAIALGAVAEPADAALEAMWRTAAVRHTEDEAELSNTTLLALGALSPALRAREGAGTSGVETQLARQLQAAADPAETGILLGALGNARNPALAPAVVPYLDHASAYVRASAADALGSLGDPAAAEVLAARLGTEPDGRVRAALAASLGALPPRADTLERVDGLILAEEDGDTRLRMARYLGENLDVFPASRTTLAKLLRKNRSKELRTYLAGILFGS